MIYVFFLLLFTLGMTLKKLLHKGYFNDIYIHLEADFTWFLLFIQWENLTSDRDMNDLW
jgi:hypothetical protein